MIGNRPSFLDHNWSPLLKSSAPTEPVRNARKTAMAEGQSPSARCRMSEDTDEKQRPEHLFKPGQSGNPSGRPKGARSRLGEAFLEAMHADFEEHGTTVIAKVRDEKPDQYLKVIASILPKDLNVNINNMDDLTDDQLIQRIRQLDSAIRPFLDTQGAGGPVGGTGPETTH